MEIRFDTRFVWIAIRDEPWARFPIEIPHPIPGPGPVIIDAGQLQLGETYILTAGPELVFRPRERLRPSIFFGGGTMVEHGAGAIIDGVGEVRTTDNSSPVATYGGSLTYGFKPQAALRFELRGYAAFMDGMDVVGPGGTHIPLEGKTMTSFSFTAGIRYAF